MADYRLSKTGQRIDDILDNSARQDAIAIVSNGNTHIAITSGEYVYIKNHGTLSEGMYRATTNIAANAALTSSNVTLEPKGVANVLNAVEFEPTYASGLLNVYGGVFRVGRIVCVNVRLSGTFTGGLLMSNMIPPVGGNVGEFDMAPVVIMKGEQLFMGKFQTNGNIYAPDMSGATGEILVHFVYISNSL